ncbi:glycosyltransferase family 4 protein [Catenovulum sp. SM1970]|uniref:glycosyltransferase family 4 protein n=1 Tax=Marinifaba aquimaris TaxID=2741323 RepID=UPI0015740911|nr:glycosyltransferase family 4 protein [Marinifaba aquimaris]NTS76894.1 glycosyltransferase family 4 protein [Marinifaba aquimaris]
MQILFLTNMSPTESEPAQGLFVRNQFEAVKKIAQSVEYYTMSTVCKNIRSSILRYLFFFLSFVVRYVFSTRTINVIHVHFFFPNIFLAIFYKLLRNPKVKIVVTFHGSDIYKYVPFSKTYNLCLEYLDHAIFVSCHLKERLVQYRKNHSILPVGIPSIFFSEGDYKKEFDFIFVGRLDINKGVERLNELAAILPSDKKLLIVGSGPERHKLDNLLEKTNISYKPFQTPEELVQSYKRSLWSLNLSHNESFGLVMTESMACGTPVIATTTDGSITQVKDGVNGVLISQNDFRAQDIINLSNEYGAGDTYKKIVKATKLSASKFKLDNIAREVVKIYKL